MRYCKLVEIDTESLLQAVIKQVIADSAVGMQIFHFDALVRGLCGNAEMQLYATAATVTARHKRDHAAEKIQAILQSLQAPLQYSTNTYRSAELHLTLLSESMVCRL